MRPLDLVAVLRNVGGEGDGAAQALFGGGVSEFGLRLSEVQVGFARLGIEPHGLREVRDGLAVVALARGDEAEEEVRVEVLRVLLQLALELRRRLRRALVAAVHEDDVAEVEVRARRGGVDGERPPELALGLHGEARLLVGATEEDVRDGAVAEGRLHLFEEQLGAVEFFQTQVRHAERVGRVEVRGEHDRALKLAPRARVVALHVEELAEDVAGARVLAVGRDGGLRFGDGPVDLHQAHVRDGEVGPDARVFAQRERIGEQAGRALKLALADGEGAEAAQGDGDDGAVLGGGAHEVAGELVGLSRAEVAFELVWLGSLRRVGFAGGLLWLWALLWPVAAAAAAAVGPPRRRAATARGKAIRGTETCSRSSGSFRRIRTAGSRVNNNREAKPNVKLCLPVLPRVGVEV